MKDEQHGSRGQSRRTPCDYARRCLVAVTGLSPQIVTETVYALAVKQSLPFVPTEVHLITTKEGAERAELSLLHSECGKFHQLCTDYSLPPIAFGPERIHTLKDDSNQPLNDIRSPEHNVCAADAITEVVRDLSQDDDCALHVSIAGGRKTMGYYLGYALSLLGREQDRLSHVLVNAPYESHPDFYYPTRKSVLIHTRGPNSRPYDAQHAEVTLAEIPFVRLRHWLPENLKGRGFSEMVMAVQRSIGPPELVLDLRAKRVRAGGKTIKLAGTQMAFLAWLARRRKNRKEAVECPKKDIEVRYPQGGANEDPSKIVGENRKLKLYRSYADEFLRELRQIEGEMADIEKTEQALRNKVIIATTPEREVRGRRKVEPEHSTNRQELIRGMTPEYFMQKKSRLESSLKKKLGLGPSDPYLVASDGPKDRTHYYLNIDPDAIHFEELAE